ncbi:MAG: alpha-L-fucosidase [Planctomycetota bacterium]|jgi:alpha-L-fucosidase
MKRVGLMLVLLAVVLVCFQHVEAKKYEPTWESLREYKEIPKWLRDGKFGIYTHWGPYAVHAYGSNTTWYSFALYMDENGEARKHFEENFGKLTPEYGYKDLIPKFTAEKFDADEWAELFEKAGAKFAGPVAEHHDGFAMWDTKYSDWNAAKMGPKRDVVGELEKAIKKRDMKFVTAFHHAANWFFFPVWDKQYDAGDPKNSGLYGQYHEQGAKRNQEFIDEWYDKIIEVIDKYSPDFIWFDFALDEIPEGYVKDFLAYYYNDATAKGKEVVVTYKGNDIVPATGVRDLELGQEASITYHEWITDSTVDDRGAWGYADDLIFKSPNRVVDNLVDRVAKNGYLLLNVGPKADGTIPEEARDLLLEVGKWLKVNGDGIYGTSPWTIASEGPTNLGAVGEIGFNESNVVYTSEDIRFTVKGDNIYATFLDWPEEEAVIKTLRGAGKEEEEDDEDDDEDEEDEGEEEDFVPLAGKTFTIGEYTWEFKEDGKLTVSGGLAGEGAEGVYEQEGEEVLITVGTYETEGTYDGENFEVSQEEPAPRYAGFYKEEIKRITMLGDDKELDWEQTREGLIIEVPDEKPCDYAYVFKIERYHHPKID